MSRIKPSVSMTYLERIVKMLGAAGKSVCLIEIAPDKTVRLHTKRTDMVPCDELDGEIERLIALHGKN